MNIKYTVELQVTKRRKLLKIVLGVDLGVLFIIPQLGANITTNVVKISIFTVLFKKAFTIKFAKKGKNKKYNIFRIANF